MLNFIELNDLLDDHVVEIVHYSCFPIKISSNDAPRFSTDREMKQSRFIANWAIERKVVIHIHKRAYLLIVRQAHVMVRQNQRVVSEPCGACTVLVILIQHVHVESFAYFDRKRNHFQIGVEARTNDHQTRVEAWIAFPIR